MAYFVVSKRRRERCHSRRPRCYNNAARAVNLLYRLNTVARFAVQGSLGPFCPEPRGTHCLVHAKSKPEGSSEIFFFLQDFLRQQAQQGSGDRFSGFQPELCAFGSLNPSEPQSSYLHSGSNNYLSGFCEDYIDNSVKCLAQCSLSALCL